MRGYVIGLFYYIRSQSVSYHLKLSSLFASHYSTTPAWIEESYFRIPATPPSTTQSQFQWELCCGLTLVAGVIAETGLVCITFGLTPSWWWSLWSLYSAWFTRLPVFVKATNTTLSSHDVQQCFQFKQHWSFFWCQLNTFNYKELKT